MNRFHPRASLPAAWLARIGSLLAATLLCVTAGCGGSGGLSVLGLGSTTPAGAIGQSGPGSPGGAAGIAPTNGAGTSASPSGTLVTPPTDTVATNPPPAQDATVATTNQAPSPQPQAIAKSTKRGIAYDLADAADFSALAPGVSWWYNWSPQASAGAPPDYRSRYQMDFLSMVWNGNFNAADIEARLNANPQVKYLLVFNEPNLSDQANLTPQQAAGLWPSIEAIAAHTGVKIVGPAITWGTMPGYADPVVWLDAFYAAYRNANGARDPQIDYLAFHWYDYGLAGQLDRLSKYGKKFWVTEFANWHSQNDGAQIDTAAKQAQQMTDMVNLCESRADVFRYAWFTGRWNNDTHATSLLAASGQLTALGKLYVNLPF
ncbi:MAG: hypothetical protein H7244_02500 [Herminiimonas sp.]|nr:hypothetical protein [Herminiimonas sp.]